MPVHVEWDSTLDGVICWVFEGNWTWEDYYNNRDAANGEIAAKDHRVDMIVDMRNSRTLPSGAMTHGRNAVNATPKNLGVTVFVGVSPVLTAFYKMFSKLYRSLLSSKELDTVMVATIEEAHQVIQQRRSIAKPKR